MPGCRPWRSRPQGLGSVAGRSRPGSPSRPRSSDEPSPSSHRIQAPRRRSVSPPGPSSSEAKPPRADDGHPSEQETVPPPIDVGLSVRAFPVANGNLTDLQFKVRRSEQEIEVPERVEIPERSAVLRDAPIVARPQCLGTAEGIGDTLVQDPTEDQAEQLVPRQVGQTQRALL